MITDVVKRARQAAPLRIGELRIYQSIFFDKNVGIYAGRIGIRPLHRNDLHISNPIYFDKGFVYCSPARAPEEERAGAPGRAPGSPM